MKRKAVVFGAGGFIGSHLVKKLKDEGCWVRGVDLKYPEYSPSPADEFIIGDLRILNFVSSVIDEGIDELYQLAADMGGAGYIFTGENDANIMHNSSLINLNTVNECVLKKVKKVFYSSSACIYPERNQMDPDNPNCVESSAYPADPDSEYGWEKIFGERLFLAFHRNYGLDIRIARFHNVFGPEGSWNNGKEKAPAAMCRKAAETIDNGEFEVWGDGNQTRSFLYIEECLEAVDRFMKSDFFGPVNIGSEEMISLNDLAKMAIDISGKNIKIKNLEGGEFIKKYGHKCPVGVRGRRSDNTLFEKNIGWSPNQKLRKGMEKTFRWIENMVKNN